jgi:L-amino acid N-acyltransferase YncA
MDELTFQPAVEKELAAMLELYNFYITTTTATFDHGPITPEEFRQRIFIGHEKYKTYIIRLGNDTVGFCFLTQHRKKAAHDRTAEIGLYLKQEFTGKGIGGVTIAFLEKIAVSKGIRVIIASISGENTASLRLFQKMGYEKCAHYKEVGEKFGRFVDVIDYEKIMTG